MMYAFMNGLLRQGRLAGILGFDIRDRILNRDSFKPGFISFWRIDRSSFYADVSVRLILDTARGRKEWRGILVLQCGFDGEGLACRALELVKDPRRKDDGLIPLSPYLVPYLRNREVDRVSERILGKYMPEAADDPGAGDAAELARRMGLKVVCLPVDDHKGIPSILFWEDGRMLFKRAHIQLDEDDRRHQALEHILRVQTSDGIKAANDYLRKMKLAPLSL